MRPFVITIVSIFMLLCSVLAVVMAVQFSLSAHPEDFARDATSYGIACLETLGTGIGLWLMQSWAFVFYAIVWVLGTALALSDGAQFDWRSVVGPVLMGVLYICYRRRFSANQSSKRTREKPRAA